MTNRVILLDLNHCLAANSRERWAWRRNGYRSFEAWIQNAERYKGWLVDLLRSERVCLLTVRTNAVRQATLDRIQMTTGWAPEAAWFKDHRPLDPPEMKERYLIEGVFPTYGSPKTTQYLALESNRSTRVMYARHTIPAIKVPDTGDEVWGVIPAPPAVQPALL